MARRSFQRAPKVVTAVFVAVQAVLVILDVTLVVPAHILAPISICLAVAYVAFLFVKWRRS